MIIFEQTDGLWLLSSMHVSIEYGEQRRFWYKISRLVLQGIPSLVAGDFNCIVGSYEKMGGR